MSTLRVRPVPALLAVIVVLVGALLLLSIKAFASGPLMPTFTNAHSVTGAKFDIPKNSGATWTLNVWSSGQLLGSATGTAGTLKVALPPSPTCHIQADVKMTRPSGKSFRYVNGNRTLSTCCPTVAPALSAAVSSTVLTVPAKPTGQTHRRAVQARRTAGVSRSSRSGAARRS